MHVAGVDAFGEQGTLGPGSDGHVTSTADVEHREGVAHDVGQGGVPVDAGDRLQVQLGVQCGQQQRTGVVDPGVDIEDDRDPH